MSIIFPQVKATTVNGKEVILNDNGTWEYIKKISNSNETGIWKIRYYVDTFGDPTDSGYIGSESIMGTFSNSATTNAKLKVRFIINKETIRIKLYEYGGNTPVTRNSIDGYEVYLKHNGERVYRFKDGKQYGDPFKAKHRSEYLIFDMNDSSESSSYGTKYDKSSNQVFMEKLKEGGSFQFVLKPFNYSFSLNTEYNFSIPDAGGFLNAYNSLFQ